MNLDKLAASPQHKWSTALQPSGPASGSAPHYRVQKPKKPKEPKEPKEPDDDDKKSPDPNPDSEADIDVRGLYAKRNDTIDALTRQIQAFQLETKSNEVREMERISNVCLQRPRHEQQDWVHVPKLYKQTVCDYAVVCAALRFAKMMAIDADDHFVRVCQPPPIPQTRDRPHPRRMSPNFFMQHAASILEIETGEAERIARPPAPSDAILFAIVCRLLVAFFKKIDADRAETVNLSIPMEPIDGRELNAGAVFTMLRALDFIVEVATAQCTSTQLYFGMRFPTDEEWKEKVKVSWEGANSGPKPDSNLAVD